MPVPQVNMSLVKSLEALTGLFENMWNPEAGPPPDQLIHAIQESRAILQTSSAILSQEGGAALEAETGARQDPELWDRDEDEAEDMADFEERMPRRGASGGEADPQGRLGTRTVDAAAEEDAHCGAGGCGAVWCPAIAGPKVDSSSHAESQRHGT